MLNLIGNFAGIAVMAIFLQNLVLTQGIGTCEVLKIANTSKGKISFSLIVLGFTGAASVITWPLDALMSFDKTEIHARTLVFIGAIGVLYLSVIGVLKIWKKLAPRAVRKLAYGAFNGVVVAVPFYNSKLPGDFWSALSFGLCAGLGFMLALWLVCEGLRRINSIDMPEAFRGLPIAFIYMGILCMAFFALSGKIYLV